MPRLADAFAIWHAGVDAVNPRRLVRQAVERLFDFSSLAAHRKRPVRGKRSVRFIAFQILTDRLAGPVPWLCRVPAVCQVMEVREVIVVGAGKCAAGMAAGVEDAFGQHADLLRGLVNVPDDAQPSTAHIRLNKARPAGSNFPTEAAAAGADTMLQLLARARTQTIAICLISGGGSALLPAPVPGVSLADKLAITQALHACGATITEMNCVRKHLSRVKGGRLAQAFRGQRLLTLLISDVPGDPLDVIASGPTVPDTTTFQDALAVLEKYDLISCAPPAIVNHLRAGARGEIPETPKSLPNRIMPPLVLANNQTARQAAMNHARCLGWELLDGSAAYSGEAHAAARRLAQMARQPLTRPAGIIFGGETIVKLSNSAGKGGRCQEFVLAMLNELGEAGLRGVTILAAGTDGEDGPTDAAGAVATSETLQRAKSLGLQPAHFLDRHDAYHFFEAVGGSAERPPAGPAEGPSGGPTDGLIKTGITGTNVTDLGVILLE